MRHILYRSYTSFRHCHSGCVRPSGQAAWTSACSAGHHGAALRDGSAGRRRLRESARRGPERVGEGARRGARAPELGRVAALEPVDHRAPGAPSSSARLPRAETRGCRYSMQSFSSIGPTPGPERRTRTQPSDGRSATRSRPPPEPARHGGPAPSPSRRRTIAAAPSRRSRPATRERGGLGREALSQRPAPRRRRGSMSPLLADARLSLLPSLDRTVEDGAERTAGTTVPF